MRLSSLVSLLLITLAAHVAADKPHSPLSVITGADDASCGADSGTDCGRIHIPVGQG